MGYIPLVGGWGWWWYFRQTGVYILSLQYKQFICLCITWVIFLWLVVGGGGGIANNQNNIINLYLYTNYIILPFIFNKLIYIIYIIFIYFYYNL